VSPEPVVHGRIPEQGRWQEHEADDGPENVVEDAAEPMGEEPEYRDHESWWRNIKSGEYLKYYETQYANR